MNLKFVIRGLLLALPMAAMATLAWFLLQTPLSTPVGPTPLPPTILAPRGPLPALSVGLQEWTQYRGEAYHLAGCGFLLSLDDGQVVAVTTAHSVSIGNPNRLLERIALSVAGPDDPVGEFEVLWGQPGRPRSGEDMTVDYVLLRVDVPVEPGLVLHPDSRGVPQAGERVSLYSGLINDDGNQRVLEGTIQSTSDAAVWVVIDRWFNPALMSGSPFVSQHTGEAVGMAVSASPRRTRLLIGMHPIASLVQLAQAATEFPRIAELRDAEIR
jgi:hypothetical protein